MNKRTYDCNYDTTTEKWSCVKTSTMTSPNTLNETTYPETLNKLTGSQIPLGLKKCIRLCDKESEWRSCNGTK